MADYAQILLLPPPAPLPQRLPPSSTGRENELAVNPETQGPGSDNARARRFRFRVVEGGETSTDVAMRRTGSATVESRSGSAENAAADSASPGIRYARGDSRQGASSGFLAQTFAQEQLGEGLYNPPFAAAAAAYSRTGAALNPPASAGLDIQA